MEQILCVTARGQGVWGQRLDVELAVARTTRMARDGLRSHTATEYLILAPGFPTASRRFCTDAERAEFLSMSFTGLRLAPVDPPEQRDKPHVLHELVGGDLAAVTFVRNYLQLQFDGGTLSLLVWPRIRRGNELLKHRAAGYHDALVGLIDTPLVAVDEVLDLGLVLDLADGTRLSVPLDGTDLGADLEGAEIALFRGDTTAMVWRPGDEDIAWISTD